MGMEARISILPDEEAVRIGTMKIVFSELHSRGFPVLINAETIALLELTKRFHAFGLTAIPGERPDELVVGFNMRRSFLSPEREDQMIGMVHDHLVDSSRLGQQQLHYTRSDGRSFYRRLGPMVTPAKQLATRNG
jgi:hypothetical protein